MANRYSNYTPSAYNPLSLEEIAMVPGMRRKQHDSLLAAQELIRSGLAKVDPLKVHEDKAIELKRGIESKLDTTAGELATNGVNNDMIGKALALNREYQDLISPTGDIGKINTAKQIYDKNKTDFLKIATEQYGSTRAAQLWENKSKEYTGFEPETNKITNIGDYGILAKQDYQKDLTLYNNLMGSTMREVGRGGGNVVYDPQLGGFKTTSSNITQGMKDNINQLNEAAKSLKSKWLTPGGEGFEFNKESGIDMNNFGNRFSSDILMQREKSSTDKQDFNISFNPDPAGDGKTPPGPPAVITDPVDLKETITDNVIDKISNLGNRTIEIGQLPPKNRYEQEADYQRRIASIKKDAKTGKLTQNIGSRIEDLTPQARSQFMDIYNAKKAQGKIPAGDKLTNYDPKTIKVVTDELKRLQYINFSNQVLVPDSAANDILASPQLIGKPAGERNEFVQARLSAALNDDEDKQGNMVFTKDGKSVPLQDIDISSVKMIGHYAAANKLKDFGGNSNNAVSPYMVTWKDKDGKDHTGLMPRDLSELGTPLFKAAKFIKKTTDKAVDREGNFTSFNKNNTPELADADLSIFGMEGRGLNGMRVKYNNNRKTFTIELVDKNNRLFKREVDTQTYQDIMYDMIE